MGINKDNFNIIFFIGIILIINLHILGININTIVFVANGFQMPVLTDYQLPDNLTHLPSFSSNIHFYYNDPTTVNYPLFTDIITFKGTVYSIGDIFQYLTVPLLVIWGSFMIYKRFKLEKKRRKN